MAVRDYFRGDQKGGVSAPNLAKPCSFVDHVVHARGKRTAYTSLSLDRNAIARFGEVDYRALSEKIAVDGHHLIEHEEVLAELVNAAREGDKAARAKAAQAIRYARTRKEGLVDWKFDVSSVERKDLFKWAFDHIQPYFVIV